MGKKTDYLFSRVWTVPNLLSFIRIVLVPIFAFLFYKGKLLWAVFVLALSGLSDFFDGKIARRFNQISELGKVLDPIADKLTQGTIAVMMFFAFHKAEHKALQIFAWVFLLFIAKELFMLLGGALMISLGLHPGAAEIYGKISTFVFYMVMLAVIAFGPEIGAFREIFTLPDAVLMILVMISLILTFVALGSYAPEIYRQFKSLSQKDKEEK